MRREQVRHTRMTNLQGRQESLFPYQINHFMNNFVRKYMSLAVAHHMIFFHSGTALVFFKRETRETSDDRTSVGSRQLVRGKTRLYF